MQVFSSIHCVTFDLDDTLWPCEPTISRAEHALYSWLETHYPRVTQNYSFADIQMLRAAYSEAHPELAHNITELRKQSLAELAKQCNYPDAMASEGLALFRKHRNKVNFFNDVFTTIHILKKRYKIGAITNGNADLDAIGVLEEFDFFVTAENAGAAKPSKQIFRYAEAQAQLASHEIVLVGDTPTVDIVGARQSGWRAIWFNPNQARWEEKIKPDAEIHQLKQLITLLMH